MIRLLKKYELGNISADTVKKFLERKGYTLNFDLKDAKLGTFTSGLDYLPQKDYHVLIACCANNGKRWVCRPENSIPSDTQYILDCAPRDNLVHLIKP